MATPTIVNGPIVLGEISELVSTFEHTVTLSEYREMANASDDAGEFWAEY